LATKNLLEIYNSFRVSINDYVWNCKVAYDLKFIFGTILYLKNYSIFSPFAWSVLFGGKSDCYICLLSWGKFNLIRCDFKITYFERSDIKSHLDGMFTNIFILQYLLLGASNDHISEVTDPTGKINILEQFGLNIVGVRLLRLDVSLDLCLYQATI